MKVKYESEDGQVSGYGDEGKAAVEAYEADPWAAWHFPWENSGRKGFIADACGEPVVNPHFWRATVAFSRMAPVIQEILKQADISWHQDWRTRKPEVFYYKALLDLEAILKETLNAGRK